MQGILKPMVLAMVCGALMVAPAFATTVTYTTLASFQGAISGATTANFDSDTPGAVILTGAGSGTADGITFHATVAGGDHELIIQSTSISTFLTTSGLNYLGTTDAGTGGSLFGSDSITMGFSSPITALGLYILGGNPFAAGTFTLDTGVGTALNSATEDLTLADGTLAYYLGITSTTPFSSATLSVTVPGGVGDGPLWNVDDITMATANNGNNPPPQVPEPGTLVLMATGLGALVRRVRRA